MADYWGLDTGHPLASGLLDGFMFDQPDIIAPVLNHTSPFSYSLVGTPLRPTIEGKLAFQARANGSDPNSYIDYSGQWLTALGRTVIAPLTMMLRFRFDVLFPEVPRVGLWVNGDVNGDPGLYLIIERGGYLMRLSYGLWNAGMVEQAVLLDTLYRVIVRTRNVSGNTYTVELWVNGSLIGTTPTAETVNEDGQTRMPDWFDRSLPGSVTDFFTWDRELSDQDIADLFADPYRFLIPPGVGPTPTNNAILFGTNF